MNYGWLNDASSDDEISRVTLHEFGHALSAIHEHQSPAANIPWDRDAVYAYYGAPPNSWTKEQIDRNIFAKYSATVTNASAFDPESIMLYAIPNSLTEGDYEVGMEPGPLTHGQIIHGDHLPEDNFGGDGTPGQPPYTKAAIGAHAEQDLFTFVVAEPGAYSIETYGPTDVIMSLLGPDSQTTLVGEDDDSGTAATPKLRPTSRPAGTTRACATTARRGPATTRSPSTSSTDGDDRSDHRRVGPSDHLTGAPCATLAA